MGIQSTAQFVEKYHHIIGKQLVGEQLVEICGEGRARGSGEIYFRESRIANRVSEFGCTCTVLYRAS